MSHYHVQQYFSSLVIGIRWISFVYMDLTMCFTHDLIPNTWQRMPFTVCSFVWPKLSLHLFYGNLLRCWHFCCWQFQYVCVAHTHTRINLRRQKRNEQNINMYMANDGAAGACKRRKVNAFTLIQIRHVSKRRLSTGNETYLFVSVQRASAMFFSLLLFALVWGAFERVISTRECRPFAPTLSSHGVVVWNSPQR